MGFFSALNALLDESSDNSFEKKIGQALDKVDATLGTTLDRAEAGIKKVDGASKKLEQVIDQTDQVTKKIAE